MFYYVQSSDIFLQRQIDIQLLHFPFFRDGSCLIPFSVLVYKIYFNWIRFQSQYFPLLVIDFFFVCLKFYLIDICKCQLHFTVLYKTIKRKYVCLWLPQPCMCPVETVVFIGEHSGGEGGGPGPACSVGLTHWGEFGPELLLWLQESSVLVT